MSIWGTLFMVAGWLTITPPATCQWSDTTSVIMLEFSEPMSIDSLLYKGNYMVLCNDTSDHKIYRIHKVGIIKELDSIQIADTTLIALITDKIPYRKSFNVYAKNIYDRAGNKIDSTKSVWFFHNGYVPNRIPAPAVDWNGYNKYIQPDTAVASGQEAAVYNPMKAIDGLSASNGDMFSRWTSPNLPQWWYCILPSSVSIREIQICFNYFDAGRTYTFDIEYSNDGINWNKFKIGVNSIPYQEFVSVSDINITAKYWKILFTGNDQSNWAGLWEVRIIGN